MSEAKKKMTPQEQAVYISKQCAIIMARLPKTGCSGKFQRGIGYPAKNERKFTDAQNQATDLLESMRVTIYG